MLASRTLLRAAVSTILVGSLTGVPASARSPGTASPPDRLEYLDPSGRVQDQMSRGNPGVFATAQGGTTFFGGTVWAADSLRWEALEDQLWTFDTGVGSAIVGQSSVPHVNPFKLSGYHALMEGWIGYDNTYSSVPYFRRLSLSDPRWTADQDGNGFPDICVGTSAGLGGNFSYWAGALPGEADALCYTTGQGYGNNWKVCIEHPFTYTGGAVTLGFSYRAETEENFDFVLVYVDTSGQGDLVEATSLTGVHAGTRTVALTQGIELPVNDPATIKIKFCFQSDSAWSDEDGLYPTTCGGFAVDNITVSGGGLSHSAGFETSNDGWILSPSSPGPGGEWSNLYHLSDLPAPLTPCPCSLSDTVLAFPDDSNGHNQFADNLAASPWIDLKAAGLNGSTGKIIKTDIYAEMPLLNYIFVQFNAQWYPEVCSRTGNLITSPWTSNGFVYYFGGIPRCTSPENPQGTQIDFSSVIPLGAEQVRMALGLLSYCRYFSECTWVSNTSPWFDNAGFGVYGEVASPVVFSDPVGRPQDNFPENGTLHLNAPGRVDCNNVQGASSPMPGTTLGDTLVVRGGVGGAEVYVHFRVLPGPGTDVNRFNTWYGTHGVSPLDPGFRVARCDTAERGGSGPLVGFWMTAYHENDPNFSGGDRDLDPGDPAPEGGNWRLANDTFPDDLFTSGTRMECFFSSNFLGQPALSRDPPAPGTYEMEILPSSTTPGGEWNCVLYVDHFNRGAQSLIEAGLTSVLGTGSQNAEGTNWDRFDVNAESSFQMSVGRPLHTEYGAGVGQILAYKVILWNTGNLDSGTLDKHDADVMIPWLTLLDFDFNNMYFSGDGIADDMSRRTIGSSPRVLFEDLGGVTLKSICNNFSAWYCSGLPWGTWELTPCPALDPVPGSVVAGAGRTVTHRGQGSGCDGRAFDVLQPVTPNFGVSMGDERYAGTVGSADFASVATDAASSGILNYRIVTDGVSVHYRRDVGPICTYGDAATAVGERLGELLGYFGYGAGGAACTDPAAGLALPEREPGPPRYRTGLTGASPNPLVAGTAGVIRFSLELPGRATLEIFDLQGRRVKTVFDGNAEAGETETAWNGFDESGTPVASGVYFYRLRALGREETRRLVVIRR